MSVYKRGDNYWIHLSRNGKEIRRSAKTKDYQKAKELEDTLAANLWRQEELGERGRVTVGEVMVAVLEAKANQKDQENLIHRMKWLREKLGDDTYLDEVDPERVAKMKAKEKWHGKPVSASTVNRVLSALSSLFSPAHKKKWIKHLPHIPFTSEGGNQRTQRLDREGSIRLLSELPMHLAKVYCYGSLTGVRENNVIGLRWSQVDFHNKVIRYETRDMKGNRIHIVPITDEVEALLEMCKGDHKEYVFTYKGKPTGKVSNHAWYKALKRAGLKGVTFHEATRHTWASWHAMSGTPAAVLKELGAWKDMRMVERYTHLAPEFLAQYAGNSKLR